MDKKKGSGRILVLGVGNILLGDEGLGVRTVEHLMERYSFPERVSLADGGTGGLKLLSVIRGYDHLIIIDAVASRSGPGALYRIPGSKLRTSPPLMTTAHQVGVSELLAVAALDGVTPEVVVLGMEPLELDPGLELSPLVSEKIPELAGMVLKELEALGVRAKEQKARA